MKRTCVSDQFEVVSSRSSLYFVLLGLYELRGCRLLAAMSKKPPPSRVF
jgi:hypothetical protein